MTTTIRIASRPSQLAVAQSELARQAIHQHSPNTLCDIITRATTADKRLDWHIANHGGKGVFVKEIQQLVLNDEADICVHSLKDMSVHPTPGLVTGAILEREDPRDVLIQNNDNIRTIGTSSLRRQCQLQQRFPDAHFEPIRGNVQRRLGLLNDGEVDAIVLAAAGLKRLNIDINAHELLSTTEYIPPAGQGAIAIECREDDVDTLALLSTINHTDTALCTDAERAVVRGLGGHCHVPIAVFSTLEGDQATLSAGVGHHNKRIWLHETLTGHRNELLNMATTIVQQLTDRGALDLIQAYLGDTP